MFHKIALAAALAGSLGAAGCAQVTAGINDVTGALSSKQATQAATNVNAFTQGFVCGLGSLSGLASTVQAQLKAQMNVGNAMVATDTGVVYVISEDLCLSLGGEIAGSAVTVPPTATTLSTAVK
jgi:hypothetical protein